MKKVLFLVALLNIYNVSFTNDINSTEEAVCATQCQQCEICLNKIAPTVEEIKEESNNIPLEITEATINIVE